MAVYELITTGRCGAYGGSAEIEGSTNARGNHRGWPSSRRNIANSAIDFSPAELIGSPTDAIAF